MISLFSKVLVTGRVVDSVVVPAVVSVSEVEPLDGVGSPPQEAKTAAVAHRTHIIRKSDIIFFMANYPFE